MLTTFNKWNLNKYVCGLLLIVYFSFFYLQCTTLHTHTMYHGFVIIHSHIINDVNRNKDSKAPFHNHTNEEIVFLDLFLHPVFLLPIFLIILLLAGFKRISYLLTDEKSYIFSFTRFPSLRAPPQFIF